MDDEDSLFVLNLKWVFPSSNRPLFKKVRDFIVTNLLFFPLVWWVSEVLHYTLIDIASPQLSKGLAHGIAISLPMLLTFIIYKFIAFRETYER